MATTTQPIYVSSGTTLVDMSVVPYMRAREVEFFANHLNPYRGAYFFFDDTNVNRFVQIPSSLTLLPNTESGVPTFNVASHFNVGDGIYCDATAGYATVVGYSPPPAPPNANTTHPITGGTLYLNENYIIAGINPTANYSGLSLYSYHYGVGDIVYQDPTVGNSPNTTIGVPSSNTFVGKVEYYNPSRQVLVISSISGIFKTNSTSTANSTAWIYNANANYSIAATNILPYNRKFADGTPVTNIRTGDTLIPASNSYIHYSGRIVANSVNANTITIAANVLAQSVNVISSIVDITSGTGLGQSSRILSVSANGNQLFLADNLSPAVDTSSTYSIGSLPQVDDNGILCGIFQLPETATVQFLSGNRVFTITDTPIVNDINATMIAKTNYLSQGYLQTYQTIRTTPVVQITPMTAPGAPPVAPTSVTQKSSSPNPTTVVDTSSTQLANTFIDYSNSLPALSPQIHPIAQTFFTPPPKSTKQNYGAFVTSVNLWFYEKPQTANLSQQFPVTVQIVETVNGFPTGSIVASSTLQSNAVNLVDFSNKTINNLQQSTTKFTFPDPVYLLPSTEYALVVYTQSPDYALYISETGLVDLTSGSALSRVSSAPFVGSFFKSQNASIWSPIPNQNLMFVLNKAAFSQDSVALTYNIDPLPNMTWMDEITFSSSDLILPSTKLVYKANTTLFVSNTYYSDPTFSELHPSTTYYFGRDLNSPSTDTISRRRYLLPGNNSTMQLEVDLQSFDPDVSPIFNQERLGGVVGTNFINNGGIHSSDITIVSDIGGHSNIANISVSISDSQLYPNVPSANANGYISLSNIDTANGNVITGITIDRSGYGYVQTPTVTITDLTPSSGNTAGGTTVVSVAAEDQAYGGNALSRYVTKQISLAPGFDAGDLQVYVDGIIPVGTSVQVYYKVLSGSDSSSFIEKTWQLMVPVNPTYSPDFNTPIEIQYAPSPLVGGKPSGTLSYVDKNGVVNPVGGKFKYFSIKIVMLAQDPTVFPILTSMRALALPGG